MTTVEIAMLTGKRHKHVLSDTRKMLEELHGASNLLKFEATYRNEQNKEQPAFALPYRETMILVSGYKLALRAKIVDRWQELEQQRAQPLPQLNDPAFLRSTLLTYTEKVLELEATVAEQAPKVEGFECIANSSGAMTIRAAAKAAQMKEMYFRAMLMEIGWTFKQGKKVHV
ncbi:hypothetical protein G5B88_14715 [Herbaspirillum seropedicae]|nr:Rha family transcriptional regulator [Herbaspirillum seropedicae]UMU22320.1 hypothetical protein G5B88_14715 [Herbaspirillum seropedicae]